MMQQFAQWDRSLFYAINRDTANGLFDFLMPLVTSFGNFRYFLIALGIYLFFHSKETRAVAILIGLAILVSDQTGNHLKYLAERIRPCNELPDVRLLGGCSGSFSFPSNHAANMFAAAMILSWKYRRYTPLFLLAAVSVAYSRVYLGVHYPSDVLGGAVIGSTCGSLALFFEQWYAPRAGHLLERFTWKRSHEPGT